VDRHFHHQDPPVFDRTHDAVRDVAVFIVGLARLPEQFAEPAGAALAAAFQICFEFRERFGGEFSMLFDLRRRKKIAARRSNAYDLHNPLIAQSDRSLLLEVHNPLVLAGSSL
jgi:hypothetical protein